MLRFLLLGFLVAVVAAPFCDAAARPNVLLICIDDLRPELKSFGADYIVSPNIDALAARGRAFHRHYVQAPTCGASRFTLLTGRYGPADNGALFRRANNLAKFHPSLPEHLRTNGYTTVSVGKVSHHPGGRGGRDWNEDAKPEMPGAWTRHLLPAGPWQHPRGAMHGLANGEIRMKAGAMDVFQSVEGPDTIYPDGLIVDEALKQLELLARDDKPFFLAAGIIRPHLPFGAPAKYLEPYKNASLPAAPHPEKPKGKTTWHGSGEFMKYNRWKRNPNTDPEFALEVRRHYAACVTYADAQVGRLVAKLEAVGAAKNTVIVVWGDHGWHLGEHAIWGKHALFEESLRSPLVVVAPQVEKAGVATNSVVETLDLFPTLCDLLGLEKPAYLDGQSLLPLLRDPSAAGHAAISYKGGAETIRDARHRLIAHKGGQLELYDHASKEGETLNIADKQPELAQSLQKELRRRLAREK